MSTAPRTSAQPRVHAWAQHATLIGGASLVVALCARVTMPLPFTPVPLTLQNFGVLLVGVALGWRRGLAALLLYLAEGALGLPVFSQGAGGAIYLFGATGGYLLAYPVVAAIAGYAAERGRGRFLPVALGALLAEAVLFASGVGWLMLVMRAPLAQAAAFGLYPFLFAEVIKIMGAAALAPASGRLARIS